MNDRTARHQPFIPRGMRLPAAVYYTGFGQTKFLELVADGRLPPGTLVDGCRLWDRVRLDEALDTLIHGDMSAAGSQSGWEDVLQ